MPELPEVETVRRGLISAMEGMQIKDADIRRPDLRWPFPPNMRARLAGQKIDLLRRRSKYLLADLSSGETLIIHLGMSGRMLVSGHTIGRFHAEHSAPGKHDHVVFHMENEARVTFNDPRRFGAMDLSPTERLPEHWLIKTLGPEPMTNSFNADYLAARLNGRGMPIKTALLDQKIIAGLGNIYVCEALHRAGILPLRKAGHISATAVEKLVGCINDVIDEAIRAGGSSLKDFRQADGELGYFQHNFQAYDRAEMPCSTKDCGGKIARIVQSGRSTFYCPNCQR